MTDAKEPAGGAEGTGEKLGRAAPWTVLTRLLTLGATMAVGAVAFRQLPDATFGLLSVCRGSLLLLALLMGLGLDQSIVRFLPALAPDGLGPALLRRIRRWQAAAGIVFAAALVALAPQAFELLGATDEVMAGHSPHGIAAVLALAAAGLVAWQRQVATATALFETRRTTTTTVLRGALWFGGVLAALALGGEVPGLLGAEAVAYVVSAGALGWGMAAALPRREGASLAAALPAGRHARYAGVIVWSGAVNFIVQRQSEVYFLAHSHGLVDSGHYDLCYSYPQLALEFVPLATSAVAMSAFAEIHGKDPAALGAAVRRYFRLLLLLTLPIATLGATWADRAMIVLFGDGIAERAHWAQAFSVIHAFPLIYIPLSAALLTLERAHRTIPLGVLQVATNIGLDLWLIPRYGIAGAVAAVAGTLLLMAPITLGVVRVLIGGLHFPGRWALRLAAATLPAALAGLLRPVLEGGLGLVVGVALSLAIMAAGFRLLGVLGPDEQRAIAALRRRLPGGRRGSG